MSCADVLNKMDGYISEVLRQPDLLRNAPYLMEDFVVRMSQQNCQNNGRSDCQSNEGQNATSDNECSQNAPSSSGETRQRIPSFDNVMSVVRDMLVAENQEMSRSNQSFTNNERNAESEGASSLNSGHEPSAPSLISLLDTVKDIFVPVDDQNKESTEPQQNTSTTEPKTLTKENNENEKTINIAISKPSNEVVYEFDVSGCPPEAIKMEYENETVNITGNYENEEEKKIVTYSKKISNIDTTTLKAKLLPNGILRVTASKLE